jgi:DNA-binding XRE family transcriptional regulator
LVTEEKKMDSWDLSIRAADVWNSDKFDPRATMKCYRKNVTREIARRVFRARKRAGYSQEDVALTLGVCRPAISEIEAGRRRICAAELVILADMFRVPVTELLP